MNEEFVPFELAKKLKEKGYPQNSDNMGCMPYYEYDEVANHSALCNEIVWHMSSEPRDNIFAAPAIHKVLKWLREEKKIHIIVEISDSGWYYTLYPNIRWENGKLKTDKYIMSFKHKVSCEQAALAGIEYVLDKKI